MICTECKKREASVHYRQTVNGVSRELHLCPECAAKLNIGISMNSDFLKEFSPFNIFGGLFDDKKEYYQPKKEKHCTLCNSTLDDILNEGKVGCAKCYEVFANELEPLIRKIHGNVGYIPTDTKFIKNTEMTETEKLREELKIAIEKEEYEKAAELRDKIKALEVEGNE